MPWKPPSFWQKDNLWARALTPASLLYKRIQKTLYNSRAPYHAAMPVMCVGNVQLGGSGKTPLVQALYKLVIESGIADNPVILLRGYGGELKGPSVVDVARHSAKDVGDEALLHAHYAPTLIARDRAAGARLASLGGHDMIIMDDGLQNNQLAKTLSFLVYNTEQGLGNARIFPAGPLRETLDEALTKCAGIFLVGDTLPFETDLPVYRTHINAPVASDPTQRYLAFCGIGQPEKFFSTLASHHYNVVETVSYADHQPYTESILSGLHHKADTLQARLITTEKDAMRRPGAWVESVETLPISYVIEQADRLAGHIKQAIAE